MPTVRCRGAAIDLAEGETVLAGLLRAGVPVSHSCRAGACQACLARATAGTPPAASQVGVKETLRARGYFLACQARPMEDLTVAVDDDPALAVGARIVSVEPLGADVLLVRVRPDRPFEARAGQFVVLRRPDGLARSYSLARVPDERDDTIELHVRVIPGGRMSGWLAAPGRAGDPVELRGPAGDCFYVPGRESQPLLLAGTGTGLAPLVGIVADALRAGHSGPIRLVHGARTPTGHYLVHQLEGWARPSPNFEYLRCALHGDPAQNLALGSLDEVVIARWPRLAGHRVFLCGDPELVARLRKRVFLAGASLAEIHADPFVPSAP